MHTTKKRRYVVWGEQETRFLVTFLNRSGDKRLAKAQRRVAHLVDQFHELYRLTPLINWETERPSGAYASFMSCAASISKTLRKHPFRFALFLKYPRMKKELPLTYPTIKAVEFAVLPRADSSIGEITSKEEPLAILEVIKADSNGWLKRIRRCRRCTRWFFTRKPGQNHDTTKCRRADYQSSEEYKAKRRANYARKAPWV